MKLFAAKTAIILSVLIAFQFINAQEKSKAELVDSFAYSGSEEASARIDNWRNQFNNSPDKRGYIIVYGARIGKRGEIEAHMRGIQQAFGFKGIDKKRVTLIKGGYREKLVVEFWILPAGSILPEPTPTIEAKKIRFNGVSRKIVPYECCF